MRAMSFAVATLYLLTAILAYVAVHENFVRDDISRYIGEHTVRGSFLGPGR